MALKQLLKGEYADDVNLLGTGLEIGAGFIPLVGQAQSGRDLTHNLQNWEWSWGHAGVTALNAFGLIPVVGGLRVVGRVSRVVPASEIRRATRAVGGGASANNARVASRFSGGNHGNIPQGFTESNFNQFKQDTVNFIKNNNLPEDQL